jgi:regulator of protease activity HflC (stomatin/prohibitin superfamily)
MMAISSIRLRALQTSREEINERIQKEMERSIEYYRDHPDEIRQRLQELDQEWGVDRMLQRTAGIIALTGITLGAFRNKRWLIPSAVASIFQVMFSITGWAPPVEMMRRIGLRTQKEIDQERCALQSILEGAK